jgi:HEAT repeat protein
MLDLPQAVAQVAAQGAWGVLIRALTCTQVREVVVGLGAPAVPALIQALRDRSENVRAAAAWALGDLGDPQAVPALSVWAHAGEDAARDALQTLGHPMLDLPQAVAQVAAQGAWGVLIRALTCTQVREVVVGLGAPAVPALIQALRDRSENVRAAAAWALGDLGDPQAVPALSVWAHAGEDAARDALQTLGHPMLDLPQAVAQVAAQGAWGVLIRALTCTQVREVVVGLGAPAVPALIQALEDSDIAVRCAAAEALGAIGDPQAVPPLIKALRGWIENVRRAAAWALVKIGTPAVPPLIRALGDSDSAVRRAAAEALGKLGDPQAVPPLSVWAHAGEDAARNALQTLGHPMLDLPQAVAQVAAQGAWGVLIRALTCTQVREVVVGLGAPAVPALIQALGDYRDDVRRAAAEALGAIGDPQAIPALSVWAHAGEYAARNALQTLGHPMLDLPQAVAQVAAQGAWGVLIRALTCAQVREVVVGLGAPAVPALIQALGDGWDDVRAAAAEALGNLGDPQAIPALIKALGDYWYDVRRAAAEALGKLGDPQAIPALIQALGDYQDDVRRAAQQAIQQIQTKQSQTKRP